MDRSRAQIPALSENMLHGYARTHRGTKVYITFMLVPNTNVLIY